MKVLIDLTSLADNFSGVERFAMSVTKELQKKDKFELVLVFKNSVHESFTNERKNTKKIVLHGNNKFFFNQLILPLSLRKEKADFYLFMAFPAPFIWFRKNTINTIHDVSVWDCPETNKKHMVAYFRILFRKAAWAKGKILTVSQFSKARIQERLHIPAERIKVVYSGVADTFLHFRYDAKVHNDVIQKYELPDKYILCLSTLEPRKNLKLLLDAYAELFRTGEINQELVLAGRRGWMVDDLMTNLEKEIADKIHFTGFIEEEHLPYIYRGAELFIFPSLYEGFGVPPLESLYMDTMVVSSDSSSLPEIQGDMALYFHNKDKNDLKRALKEAMSMERAERIAFVRQKREYLMQYTWEQVSDKIVEFAFVR